MKSLAVLLFVLGGFAIYTFGWRDNGEGDDRPAAEAAVQELIGLCDSPDMCRSEGLVRVAPGIWRVTMRQLGQRRVCLHIHLDDFRPIRLDERREQGLEDFTGLARVPCEQ